MPFSTLIASRGEIFMGDSTKCANVGSSFTHAPIQPVVEQSIIYGAKS